MLDLIRVRRIGSIFPLNEPEQSLCGSVETASPLGAITWWSDVRPTVLVGRDEGQVVGFAEFRPMLPDLRWHLVSVGVEDTEPDPLAAWIPILDQGTRVAGQAGVKRLYARAPKSTVVGDALRASGYAPYATEVIFEAENPTPLCPDFDVREQERADTWAVHQLYNSSVPKEVLYAEAYTSHRWELPRGRRVKGKEIRAWIAERNDVPVAYARCTSVQRRHVLDVMFVPGHLEEMAALIDQVVILLERKQPVSRMYCAVRGYTTELERVLLDRQFRPWLSQELHVRYTTAPVRAITTEMVLSDAEAVERTRRRVPVYLAGVENND
jgi:hypothetical protein